MGQKLYYIQNGWIGNAIVWWRINAQGYTTDINEAGKFDQSFINKLTRSEDVAWDADYIDGNQEAKKLIVDSQYLDSKYSIRTKKLQTN